MNIRVLALDVDGVLTDGRLILREDGQESKAVCFQDIDAIVEARRLGLHVVLVTGEQTPWVHRLARRLDLPCVLASAKDKLTALGDVARRYGVSLEEICFVGDSDRDAPALHAAGLGLVPANGSPGARRAADTVLRARGGESAVSEVVSMLRDCAPVPELMSEVDGAATPPLDQPGIDAALRVRRWADDSIGVLHRAVDEMAEDIARAARIMVETLQAGGKLLIFGNGGSAADSQHFSAELLGRFERERRALAAVALTTDTSALTALGNDYGEHTIFARQVEALGRPGDIGLAISTSGHSPNVLNALVACRRAQVRTIGLTGRDGGGMKNLVDLCLIVPAESTARIQEAHAFIIHALCGLVERDICAGPM